MTTEVEMKEQVQEVLDKLRPFLLRDGGDCEIVDVKTASSSFACSAHAEAAQVPRSPLKLELSAPF
jgi:hypothetical protein